MSEPTLAERVTAIDRALDAVPHAFGGALALAYYAEPRATIDVDVNVFVSAERCDEVFAPLHALGAATGHAETGDVARRDGQVRVMWDSTPIDLFFSYDPFHDAASTATRIVRFGGGTIPILSPEHLIVCKAVFNRAKDWIDIQAIVDDGTVLDAAEALRWVARVVGDTDPRFDRLVAVLARH